jgi:thiol-disulfide isomerase/thioredoxin
MYQRLEKFLVGVLTVCALAMTGLAVRRELREVGARRNPPSEFAAVVAPTMVPNGRALALVGRRLGARGAPITLVEFSDFECPYCYALHATLAELLCRHGRDVAIVFRHYPRVPGRASRPGDRVRYQLATGLRRLSDTGSVASSCRLASRSHDGEPQDRGQLA